jgi:hypothetical protein
VGSPLLLDAMLSARIADALAERGHDVTAVITDPALAVLPDEQLLEAATTGGRALVTANIKDFVPLDARWKAAQRRHAGLVLVSTKTFPQDRSFTGALVDALHRLLTDADIPADAVLFLTR